MNYKEQIAAFKNEKRNEIIVKAYWLFLDKGIDSVTLEDVAKASEIAPITVYRYFGDKKTLVIACGELFWEETYKLNNPTTSKNYQKLTGYEQVKLLISSFIPALLKYPQHLRFLRYFDAYMERCHVSSDELEDYDASIGKWNSYCHDAFMKGIEDHTVKSTLDFNTFYFTSSHMLMAFSQKLACTGNLLPSDSLVSSKKQIELAVDILLSYCRAEA